MGQTWNSCCTTADTQNDKKLELAPAFQGNTEENVSSEVCTGLKQVLITSILIDKEK